ncbi:Adaptive-response sensory-kinase SasA [Arenibacter antarcticus]|uniref:histidine kinase n=1 Tax=Arenibacter antarcticus TaxID=2040469 RepID=A0ABW5VMM0_9FLAO|nr:ATP-binding protein [Arenibacter sp. H213]MCM4166991.1 hypothetical protein [Arenibacter sp. H213]
MVLKKLAPSPKVYIIMLIAATALLLFIGSISYRQIDRLGKSAESVTSIMQVDMQINHLFSYYGQMQATELRNRLLQDSTGISTFEVYMPETLESIKILEELTSNKPAQQKILKKVKIWQDSLFLSLKQLAATPYNQPITSANYKEKVLKVTSAITELSLLRNQMYSVKQKELAKRKAAYASQISFTPLTILFLGTFAVLIFVVSFIQINILRKKTTTAERFLANILACSDNIISYFEPIYDDSGKVKDFTITFSNEKIESILGKKPDQIANTKMSENLPENFKNGIFQELVQIVEEGSTRKFEKLLEYNGKKSWLRTTATLMDDGVLTTSMDTTTEKKFTKNLKLLNEKLEFRNKDLIQTKAFLNNILESASNTVSHLNTEIDKDGNIIDFRYLFTNKETENLTGNKPKSVIGKSITETFPSIHNNGLFKLMVKCATQGSIETHETKYYLNNKWKWVHTTINKLNTGITLTSYDSTEIIKAKQVLLELNEQLTIQNSILKDAEAVAKIGSYRWDLKTNEATMSDNFYRLLDCEANEFIATSENYDRFIHPKDRNYYNEKLQLTTERKHDGNFNYRIITKTGKIKHLQHSGHFVQNEFIGVVKDITTELKNEQKLKDKNLELKRSNSELESFNRVASHDLQEPLRKIQIFISRITEENTENVSSKNLEYLHKVSSSANRMQTLIRYLLAYSRLNKDKKGLSTVDLNEILEKVLEDLEAPIKEKGVSIEAHNLPELSGVPFQLEQLFNNLLSNSIKYSSVLNRPKIEIDCQQLKRKQITDNFQKKHQQYYCITIKDNGIGFDQSNAKKIFGLFQRLHQKNEYSGTGIGLAICKKIAENHKGHIVAEGTINKGANFRIYLPA